MVTMTEYRKKDTEPQKNPIRTAIDWLRQTKNPMVEPGIAPGTSCTLDNYVITEPSLWPIKLVKN